MSILVAAGALPGCFYLESINQRPAIDIIQTSSETVYRRTVVRLEAEASDPEGQIVFKNWRAYACVDANDFGTCDGEPFADSVLDHLEFMVPDKRVDVDVPVQSVLVYLEAQDEYGAVARPRQQLIIPVANHAPVLEMSLTQQNNGVVGTPIDLFLKIRDIDDGPATVTLDWQVFTPTVDADYTFGDLDPDPPDTVEGEIQTGKRLTPDALTGEGTWNVVVTATDPLGATAQKMYTFDVGPDDPPCLEQWSPIAAPAGSSYLLTEPTLFQVTYVYDDLDPYPATSGIEFDWQLKVNAGAWTSLGLDANHVPLDPSNYAPGDAVQLRVEIQDRKQTVVNCPDTQQTCSVNSTSCIQRQTWRLEVR